MWINFSRTCPRKSGSGSLDTYQDINNRFKSPGIVSVDKLRKFEWIKHFVRINIEKTIKKLSEGKPREGSKQGRPRLRWLNDAELGLKIMSL